MAYRRPRQPTTILWKPAISEWGKILGALSNQLDLQTALDAKVPYTGATADVDLGKHHLTVGQYIRSAAGANLTFEPGAGLEMTEAYDIFLGLEAAQGGYYLWLNSAGLEIYSDTKIVNPTSKIGAIFDISLLTTANKTFTFPDASGTLALTSFSRTFLLMGA